MNGNRPANLLGKYDAMSLIQRPHLAAESQLIDDGHGEMVIYRVGAKGDIIEIPKRNNIALFSGDCYLIHYIVTVSYSLYTLSILFNCFVSYFVVNFILTNSFFFFCHVFYSQSKTMEKR